MKNILLYSATIFFASITSNLSSQVRQANGTTLNLAPNSSAFFDASSVGSWNNSQNVGKGMVFPRVSLAQFTSFSFSGTPGIGSNYPSRFDGFIVYNIDSVGVAGVGQTEGTLTRGFWYYQNKSNSLNGGIWKPFNDQVGTNNTVLFITTPTYSVLPLDGTLLVDVPSGGAMVMLPQANTTNSGKILTIKKVDNDYDVLSFSEQIKYSSSDSFTTLNYVRSIVIQSDGSNWWLLN
jgi:hypothetical protein